MPLLCWLALIHRCWVILMHGCRSRYAAMTGDGRKSTRSTVAGLGAAAVAGRLLCGCTPPSSAHKCTQNIYALTCNPEALNASPVQRQISLQLGGAHLSAHTRI